MSIQIISTTDSPEQVKAAMGSLKPEESKEEEKSAPENKDSQEQKESSESVDEDKKEEKEVKDELDDSDSDEDPEKSDDSEKDKPKKKGGFQRRIDKLSSQKAAAQEEAKYWKSLALQSQAAGETKKEPVENKVTAEGEPNPDQFDTHVAYVKALADWTAEQKFKARDLESQKSKMKTEQEALVKSHFERVKSFAEKNENFMEVLESVDDVPASDAVREIIITSENGPALMYELAKNRDEYARICKLPPLAAARELGKIESKIASSSSDDKKQEPKKITKAPQPISPVGQKGGKTDKPLDQMSYQEFKKAREAQLSRR